MQFESKEIEFCKLNVTCEINKDQINEKELTILDAFKTKKVPGFRKGKAPAVAIKTKLKKEFQDALKFELVKQAFEKFIGENKIAPFGNPTITQADLLNDRFFCSWEMYKKPEVSLTQYKEFEHPKVLNETIEDLVTDSLTKLKLRLGEQRMFEEGEFVEMGDQIVLNYEGFMDGEKQAGLSADAQVLTVGNAPIKEFDDNLLGMKVGDKREFTIKSTEGKGNSDLKDKDLIFKVELISATKLSSLKTKEEVAEKMAMSIEDFEKYILSACETQLKSKEEEKISELVCTKLIELNEFKIPNWMSLFEAKYLAQSKQKDWTTLSTEEKEKFVNSAEKNVRLSLILDKVRELEVDCQLNDREVFDKLKESFKNEEQFASFIEQAQKNNYLPIVASQIKDQHVISFIGKTIKWTDSENVNGENK